MVAMQMELPADTRAVLAALRRDRWYPVTGNTLNIGKITEEAKAESGDSEDVKKHLALWDKFRQRLDKRPKMVDRHPQLRGMADDIRFWEAAKAGVNLADERKIRGRDYTIREWFMKASAVGRIELVKQERARRSEERRFKLALKKKSLAA